jgi:hypothetical protein
MLQYFDMSNFLGEFRQDLLDLRLKAYPPIDPNGDNPPNYNDAFLAASRARCTSTGSVPTGFTAQTELGDRLAEHLQNRVNFGSEHTLQTFWGCSQSEFLLLRSLETTTIADHTQPSPVVVVDGNKPVAVVKQQADPTAYTLHDNARSRLLAGTLSFFNTLIDPKVLPTRSGVYVVNLADAGPATPIRYSTLAIPTETRQELVRGGEFGVNLAISPASLLASIEQALETNAHLLSPTEVEQAKQATFASYAGARALTSV